MHRSSPGPYKVREARIALEWLERLAEARPKDRYGSPLDEYWRLRALHEVAVAAFEAGELDRAESTAREIILELPAATMAVQRPGFGDDVLDLHYAHVVLGRAALTRGDVAQAEEHLAAAAGTKSTPVFKSFGPDTDLAQELLELGRVEPVLSYLRSWVPIWTFGRRWLPRWIEQLERGRTPDLRDRSRTAPRARRN
jgi:hypothetical protein